MKLVFKYLGLAVIGLGIFIILALGSILYTEPASRWFFNALGDFTPDEISISHTRGALMDSLTLDVAVTQSGQAMRLDNLTLGVSLFTCQTVCVNNLHVKRLHLTQTNAAASEQTDSKVDTPSAENTAGDINLLDLPGIGLSKLKLDELVVESPTTKLTVKDVELKTLSLTRSLAAKTTLRVESIDVASIAINNHAKAPQSNPIPDALPAIILPPIPYVMDVVLNRLYLGQLTLDETALTRLGLNQLQLTKKGLKFKQFAFTGFEGQHNVKGNILFTPQWHFDVHTQHGFKSHDLSAELNLNGPLSALELNAKSQGVVSADLDAKVDVTTLNYPHTVTLNWQQNAALNELEHSEGTLTLAGDVKTTVLRLDADSKVAAIGDVSANVSGDVGLHQGNFDDFLLSTAKGAVSGQAKVQWQRHLSAYINTQVSKLNLDVIDSRLHSDISGALIANIALAGQKPTFDIREADFQGEIQSAPFSLTAEGGMNQSGDIHDLAIKLKALSHNLTLSGALNDFWGINGRLTLGKGTQAWPITGDGELTFGIEGKRKTPELVLDGKVARFSYANDVRLEDLNLSVHYQHQNTRLEHARVRLKNAKLFGHTLSQLTLDGQGSLAAHSLTAALNSDYGALKLALDGQSDGSRHWQGKLSQLEASQHEQTLVLASPLALKVAPGNVLIGAHCWQGTLLNACSQSDFNPFENSQLALDLTAFSLESAALWLPEYFKEVSPAGTLSGTLNADFAKGAFTNLTMKLESEALRLTKVSSVANSQTEAPEIVLSPLKLEVNGNQEKVNLVGELHIQEVAQLNTQLEATQLATQPHITGEIAITSGDLAPLKPFVPLLDTLAGEFSGKVAVSGDLKAPLLEGDIGINKLSVSGATLPLSLVDSALELNLRGQDVQFNGTLHTPNEGELSVAGHAKVLPTLIVTAKVQGQAFKFSPMPGSDVYLDPNIQLEYQQDKIQVHGVVGVPRADIVINDLPQSAVTVSRDQVIVGRNQQAAQQDPLAQLILAVQARLGEQVRVRAFGLDSHITGGLDVSKSPNSPLQASGELRLKQGRFKAYGQNLLIRRGNISFAGPLDTPYLDIDAIRNPEVTRDDVIAGVKVSGTAHAPRLQVFSEPSMDQSRALAYLLNGQPLGEGETDKNALLTSMLLSQGISRSEGTVSQLGALTGLDDVKLTASGSGDTTKVNITGQVNEDIQVRYSIGVFDSLSEVAVRYRILPKLYLEAINGVDKTIDLLYKFTLDDEENNNDKND